MGRNIGSLSDIKTGQKAKVRTIPKVEGSNYLDLFMLSKERDRLKQEKSVVDKRKEQLEANLKNIEQRVEMLEEAVPQEDKQTRSKKRRQEEPPKKEWKTMSLNY